MQTTARAYLAGQPFSGSQLLEHFLPPYHEGVISAWLKEYLPPGGWVLDPLGSTPFSALEAARAGYRVLVASNNPILTLLLEVLAAAPPERELQAVLAELAASRRLDERLEIHVQSLYQTECPACNARIQSDGFIWDREQAKPVLKLIQCPVCGAHGEYPLSAADEERATPPGRMELHRARAIERISSPDSPLHAGAVEAMQVYQPRALYIVSTIINRIEGLNLPESRRKLLWALALSMLDAGTSLWGWPEERNRPRQLSIPPRFRESNLWLVLEQTVRNWPRGEKPVFITRWPNLPPEEGGICVFPGRLREWLPLPRGIQPLGAMAVVPRPNQAFWTLSAVWAGWLWGREAVLPLKGTLERRRYDWQWHAGALHHTLSVLKRNSAPEMPIFLVCPELVPGFYSAISAAASAAGYLQVGQALCADAETAQLVLQGGADVPSLASQVGENLARTGIEEVIKLRNEPTPYLLLHAAGLDALARGGGLPFNKPEIAWDTLTKLQNLVGRVFNKSESLIRYGSQAQASESGWWWLAQESGQDEPPLADRVEMEIIRLLIRQGGTPRSEIETIVYDKYPGWLTPDTAWLDACLDSYAEADERGTWRLRQAEQPANRRQDLLQVGEQLAVLAGKLGLGIQGENPWEWRLKDGTLLFRFYGLASSMLARYILAEEEEVDFQRVIILPGSRAKLATLKLHRDMRLQQMTAGWHFLKFRHLRTLAERADINLDLWNMLLDADPISGEAQQPRMLF